MLRLCRACHQYSMQETCPHCRDATEDPRPPKFSPEDRYGAYRRRLKRLHEHESAREDLA